MIWALSTYYNAIAGLVIAACLFGILSGCTYTPAEDHIFTPSDREILRPYLGGFPSVACTDYGIPIPCSLIIEEDS